jgi:thymidine phosphorylase
MVCFAAMVHAMETADITDDWHTHLPRPPSLAMFLHRRPEQSLRLTVKHWVLVVHLGGGRLVESDRIDPRVGLTGVLPLGTKGLRGDPIATIHTLDEDSAQAAAHAVRARGRWTVEIPDLIERIDP